MQSGGEILEALNSLIRSFRFIPQAIGKKWKNPVRGMNLKEIWNEFVANIFYQSTY